MADFDRRIRLVIRAEGTRNSEGAYVEGPIVVDEDIWCRRADLGSSEDLLADGSGTVVTSFVNYTIRYRMDVASIRDGLIRIVDEFDRTYYIRKVSEADERRRYLVVEAGYITV